VHPLDPELPDEGGDPLEARPHIGWQRRQLGLDRRVERENDPLDVRKAIIAYMR
jgi:hypothetical protein